MDSDFNIEDNRPRRPRSAAPVQDSQIAQGSQRPPLSQIQCENIQSLIDARPSGSGQSQPSYGRGPQTSLSSEIERQAELFSSTSSPKSKPSISRPPIAQSRPPIPRRPRPAAERGNSTAGPTNQLICAHCKTTGSAFAGQLLRCSACNLVRYCGPVCQKSDWKVHKMTCKANRVDHDDEECAASSSNTDESQVFVCPSRRFLPSLLTSNDWLYGTICGVPEQRDIVYIKPASPLPQKYIAKKDVLVRMTAINGTENLLPLKEKDKVEFQLSSKPREADKTPSGIKPYAYKANVLAFCADRTLKELTDFFNLTTVKVKKESSQVCTLNDIMTNDALWFYLFNLENQNKESGMYQKYKLKLLDLIFFLNDYMESFPTRRNEVFNFIGEKEFLDAIDDSPEGKSHKMKFIESSIISDPTCLQAMLPMIKGMLGNYTKLESDFMYSLLLKIANITDLSNWQELKQIPTIEELFGDPLEKVKYLKPVLLDSEYSSTDQYLNVYFRLMRTECFSAIQKGILDFKKGKLDERDMSVYYNVSVDDIEIQHTKMVLSLQFHLEAPVRNWNKSQKLMFGNLLCLSANGEFTDPIWVTVADRNPERLTKSRVIGVELVSFQQDVDIAMSILSLIRNSGRMTMVESPTYFQSFRYILFSLKHSKIKDFCLVNEIVYGKYSFQPFNNRDPVIAATLQMIYPTLEAKQKEAFDHALQSSLAIIQGPPGTGKTYVGAKIVEYFLKTELSEGTPILLLTYKNHALDEFLKHCLDFCDAVSLARIGGQSKEPDLEKCLLREKLKSSTIRKDPSGYLIGEIEELFVELEKLISILEKKKIINFKIFLHRISEIQFSDFLEKSLQPTHKNDNNSYRLLEYYHKSHDVHMQIYTTLLGLACDSKYTITSELNNDAMKVMLKKLETAYTRWVPDKGLLYNLTQLQQKGSSLFNKSEANNNFQDEAPADDNGDGIDELDEDYINELYSSRASAFDDDLLASGKNKAKTKVQFSGKGKTNRLTFTLSDFPTDCNVNNALLLRKTIWDMDDIEKYTFIYTLLQANYDEISDQINSILEQIHIKQKKKEMIDQSNKVKVLETQKIVGATIVGASVQLSLIKKLQPKIVIVEEAAEILEACLVGVLTESVEKLILIGDHKQLRPQVDTYSLRKDHNFHVSMMERLILIGFPYKSLLTQGRMRPEFSNMLKDIYPDLKDFPNLSTKNVPIKCLPNTMYFWSHDFPESKERSVKNLMEANMVVALALYFTSSGVSESDITILCAYLGQVQTVRKLYQELNPQPHSADKKMLLNIRTIDEYQGDENEFLIISLTRSNSAGKIGFMKEKERRCVAQSRAKCGMYFVGNADLFKKSPTWKGIINSMQNKNLVSDSFNICCPKHPDYIFKVVQTQKKLQKSQNKDRNQLMYYVDQANNWCTQICKELFDCKIEAHRCKDMCTPTHSHSKCMVTVPYLFTDCGHDTHKKCHINEKAMKCKVNIKNILPCGHEKIAECNEWTRNAKNKVKMMCLEECEDIYNCTERHKCTKVCGRPHEHYSGDCPTQVEFTIQSCGHTAHFKKKCGGPVPTSVKCKVVVDYVSTSCQHKQRRPCHEVENCQHPCKKLRADCGHPCTMKCFQACMDAECEVCKEKYREALNAAKEFAKKQLEICKTTQSESVTITEVSANSSEYTSVSDKCRMFFNLYASCTTEISAVKKIYAPSDLVKFWEKATLCNGVVQEELFKLLKGTLTEEFEIKRQIQRGKIFEFVKYASKRSTKEDGEYTLVIADVLLGEMINKTDPQVMGQMNITKMTALKKDSVQCISPDGPAAYWVFDDNQIKLKYIVHISLKRSTVSVQLNPVYVLDGLEDGLQVIDLENFDFRDQSNPMCDYITKAISLYKGDCLKRPSYSKTTTQLMDVKRIGLVVNHAASAAYDKRLQELKKSHTKCTEIFAYHATADTNVDSIVKNSLDPNRGAVHGRAHGDGCYFSEHPNKSHGYGNVMFIFKLILVETFYTKVSPDKKGFCIEIVIKDAAFFKPVYLLYF